MTKVLYPGSFDPMTKGHMNIVEQTIELFDEILLDKLLLALSLSPHSPKSIFVFKSFFSVSSVLYIVNLVSDTLA